MTEEINMFLVHDEFIWNAHVLKYQSVSSNLVVHILENALFLFSSDRSDFTLYEINYDKKKVPKRACSFKLIKFFFKNKEILSLLFYSVILLSTCSRLPSPQYFLRILLWIKSSSFISAQLKATGCVCSFWNLMACTSHISKSPAFSWRRSRSNTKVSLPLAWRKTN